MPKTITTAQAIDLLPMVAHWLDEYNDEETSDERREELERLLLEADGAIASKADAIQDRIEILDGEVESLDTQIKRRQIRKKSREAQIERNRRLQDLLLGGKGVKTPENTFFYAANKIIVVDDLTKIPENYIRRADPEPMKREILAAIASGQFVPGAHVEQTKPTLRVR